MAREISWHQIHDVAAAVLDEFAITVPTSVDEVIDADRRAREDAKRLIGGMIS